MTKDKNIKSSSTKENPHNPSLLPSDITNLPEEERAAIQGQLPASGQISGPIQWPPMFPPVQWYPIQTQWGTGPGQAWVQHLPGEASYLGLTNQPSVNHPTPSSDESDPTTDFKTTKSKSQTRIFAGSRDKFLPSLSARFPAVHLPRQQRQSPQTRSSSLYLTSRRTGTSPHQSPPHRTEQLYHQGSRSLSGARHQR